MVRAVIRYGDNFTNIPADRLEEREGMVFIYNADALVAVFDLGAVDLIYLTEKKDSKCDTPKT